MLDTEVITTRQGALASKKFLRGGTKIPSINQRQVVRRLLLLR
jgi:hypothetical protein